MNRLTKVTAGLGTAAIVLTGLTGTALADTGTPAVSSTSPTASSMPQRRRARHRSTARRSPASRPPPPQRFRGVSPL